MSTFLKILVMAVVQGVTEFLPVSSSGHLVIAKALFNLQTEGAALEVALHAGTLLSVLVFYRRRLGELAHGLLRREAATWRYAGLILLGSLPAALAGLLLSDRIAALFDSPRLAGLCLLATGAVLLSMRWAPRATRERPGPGTAVAIGFAQVLALLPGISRSGSTVCTARHLGIYPREAVEYSMLMVIPLLTGASILELPALFQEGAMGPGPGLLAVGALVAAGIGYASIALLVRVMTAGRLWWFGVYCGLLGAAAILFA